MWQTAVVSEHRAAVLSVVLGFWKAETLRHVWHDIRHLRLVADGSEFEQTGSLPRKSCTGEGVMLGNGQMSPDPKSASIVEQVGRFEDS